MHCGDPAEGARALEPLRQFGTPVADLSETMRYLDAQAFFDPDYPDGHRYYWKSAYLDELSEEAISVLIEHNARTPSPVSTLDLWQLGGKLSRPGADATAFGERSHSFMVGIESNWERPEDDAACVEWAREAHRLLQPFAASGEYVNFPGFYEEGAQLARNSYGTNYTRLRALKEKYDPGNMWRLNPNIVPT